MPRFAFSEPSIGSTTTVQRPSPSSADLLADDAHVLAAEALEDHALGRGVDRRRLVAALAGADDRLALGAQRQLGEHARDVVRARRGRAASQSPSYRVEEQAGRQLREEERRLLRHRLAAHARSARPARRSPAAAGTRPSASPRSTAAIASFAYAV